MKIEPVTRAQVDALASALGGHIPAMIARLHEVDLSRGRGVLEGHDRCLWTKDGRRITVSVSLYEGSVIASCGHEPDPEAPSPK